MTSAHSASAGVDAPTPAASESALAELISKLQSLSTLSPQELIPGLIASGLPDVALHVARHELTSKLPASAEQWRQAHTQLLLAGEHGAAQRLRDAVPQAEFGHRTGLNFWGETVRACLQQTHGLQKTLERLLQIDPIRLAVRVSNIRRRQPQQYAIICSALRMVLADWSTDNAVAQAALKLAVQDTEGTDEKWDERLLALFQQLAIADLSALLRTAFTLNVERYRGFARRLFQDPEKLRTWGPRALFRLLAIGYIHLADEDFHALVSAIRAVRGPLSEECFTDPRSAVRAIAERFARTRIIQGPPPAVVSAGSKTRLSIAICVSGQLRAYKEAFPSWAHLGLRDHDVDFYVHTWAGVGWRFPNAINGNGADRAFAHSPFVQAYMRAGSLYGQEALVTAYSRLFGNLSTQVADVTAKDVRSVYGEAARIEIEPEDYSRFPNDAGNQHKMFYKIAAAQGMVDASGKSYDLVVRLRADRSFRRSSRPVDWLEMWQQSRRDHVVFGEPACIAQEMYVDDQFAIGTPEVMRAYASTAAVQRQATQEKWYGFVPRLAPHLALAHSLFFQGIRVRPAIGLRPGAILGMHPLSRDEIRTLLAQDLPDGPSTAMDKLLWDALR